jgi:hypothetical protein
MSQKYENSNSGYSNCYKIQKKITYAKKNIFEFFENLSSDL